MSVTKIFRTRLKAARELVGMTQSDLARKMGCDPSVICFYENGQRSPGLENLVSVADALNMSLDYLTGRTDKSMLFVRKGK